MPALELDVVEQPGDAGGSIWVAGEEEVLGQFAGAEIDVVLPLPCGKRDAVVRVRQKPALLLVRPRLRNSGGSVSTVLERASSTIRAQPTLGPRSRRRAPRPQAGRPRSAPGYGAEFGTALAAEPRRGPLPSVGRRVASRSRRRSRRRRRTSRRRTSVPPRKQRQEGHREQARRREARAQRGRVGGEGRRPPARLGGRRGRGGAPRRSAAPARGCPRGRASPRSSTTTTGAPSISSTMPVAATASPSRRCGSSSAISPRAGPARGPCRRRGRSHRPRAGRPGRRRERAGRRGRRARRGRCPA